MQQQIIKNTVSEGGREHSHTTYQQTQHKDIESAKPESNSKLQRFSIALITRFAEKSTNACDNRKFAYRIEWCEDWKCERKIAGAGMKLRGKMGRCYNVVRAGDDAEQLFG